MSKVIVVLLVLIVLLTGIGVAHAGEPDFRAEVCRMEDTIYRVTVWVSGQESQHVWYVLEWGYSDLGGDFWVAPDQPTEVILEPDGEPNAVVFFQFTDGVWQSFLRLELNWEVEDCNGRGKPDQSDQPGCDQFMPVSEDAVLVTFVADSDLLWFPDPEIGQTGLQVQAGQTVWMTGEQDGYAEIVWACDLLYVSLDAVKTD